MEADQKQMKTEMTTGLQKMEVNQKQEDGRQNN